MAWRVIDTDGELWHVYVAAERRANANLWQLALSFRTARAEKGQGPIWAQFPLEAVSKSSLFRAAERISDEALRELLAQHIS
ncbi:MAG: hypothetical protein ACE5HT_10875 [Gemmatimonadales bacterium]